MAAIDNQAADHWPRYRRLALYLGLALGGAALDLWTKELVFSWRGLPEAGVDNTWWLWEGYVGIQTSVNQGALFGMGQGGSTWFAVLAVMAAAGIFYWLFFRGAARDLVLTFTLGCVTGGILGNLYDRLGLWHEPEIASHFRNGVRDWILFRYRQFSWPNFNIADSLLVCGAILLVAHAFWPRKSTGNAQPGADQDEAPGKQGKQTSAAETQGKRLQKTG